MRKAQDWDRWAKQAAVPEAWGGVVAKWLERQVGAKLRSTLNAKSYLCDIGLPPGVLLITCSGLDIT